jgi:2-oxoglutarate dehydrogenase E2 component (dihydrolipoamide succinyltransferase)
MLAEILIPSPGESVTDVTLSAWLKADGDYVRKDEELFEIESEKATLSVAAHENGRLEIRIREGEEVKVGTVAAVIDTEVDTPASVRPAATEAKAVSAPAPATATVHEAIASPAAQKLMDERGLRAGEVKGTGKDGRITKGDVLTYPAQPGQPETPPAETPSAPTTPPEVVPPAPGPAPTLPQPSAERATRNHKLSTLRLKVAERLVAAKNQAAMLTTFNEVDMSAVMAARAKYKELFKQQHEVGLGFMSFFVKAVIEALGAFPAVNAMIDGEQILYHDYVDMGIAVSAPKGLVVPVIRNAERKTFAEIEAEIARLASRARNNQLTLDEMTGGTFTISNGGVFGSMLSTPILNPPQSGILGMHNIVERPVAINGQVEIRPIMYVALSYDHRIIDGRESVSFLVRVKELLEDPMRLLLKV